MLPMRVDIESKLPGSKKWQRNCRNRKIMWKSFVRQLTDEIPRKSATHKFLHYSTGNRPISSLYNASACTRDCAWKDSKRLPVHRAKYKSAAHSGQAQPRNEKMGSRQNERTPYSPTSTILKNPRARITSVLKIKWIRSRQRNLVVFVHHVHLTVLWGH